MRARYYNPDIKRFINQDIKVGDIGSSQSLNRYAYCEGNPVSMVDPFGLCGKDPDEINWLSLGAHLLLGAAGTIPVVGFVFDLADAALCYYEGDTVGVALSLASAIPISGLAVGAGKLGRQTLKFGGYLADVIRNSGKMTRFAAKTADIAEGARTLLRSGIPEKFAAFSLKGSKVAKILQKGGDALKDVGRVMKHQGERIYTSAKELINKFCRKKNDNLIPCDLQMFASNAKKNGKNLFKWGNHNSIKTYGHTFSMKKHSAKIKVQQLIDRARELEHQVGKWLDNQKAADYLTEIARKGEGVYYLDLPEDVKGLSYLGDGTELIADKAVVVVKENGSILTAYPYNSNYPLN